MRKDIRSVVVDRMQKIKPAEDSFTMPPGFSLESYLRHSFGMFTEELLRVKVRFHKSMTRYLLERRWHPSHAHVHGRGSIARTFPEKTRSKARERMERLERTPDSIRGD